MQSSDKNEILLAIEKINQKIDFVKEDLRQEMQEQLKVIPEMQEQLKAIPEIQKELRAIPEIKEELRRISRTVAKMEVDHGEKLAALFDAFTAHSEKLDIHDKRILVCEKRIEHQSNQIYHLNSKIQEL